MEDAMDRRAVAKFSPRASVTNGRAQTIGAIPETMLLLAWQKGIS